MSGRFTRVASAVLSSVVLGSAVAHHSPAAFDQSKQLLLEGKLTKLALNNPHTYLTLEIVGPDGRPVLQEVEAGPLSTIHVTVEDPVYLSEPAHYSAHWEFSPELAPSGVESDLENARQYLREEASAR